MTATFLTIAVLVATIVQTLSSTVLQLRGGIGPRPAVNDEDYYSQFELDYGTEDTKRSAGALRGAGFLPDTLLSSYKATTADPFLKWVYDHLEKGPEPFTERIKPFYAADFGSRASLKKGENPKVMIVTRKLSADKLGFLTSPPDEIDVEIREIWQPWLKQKCNFAVRYIIPNRVNIMKIMEAKGRFVSIAKVEDDEANNKSRTLVAMTFKPSWLSRLVGKRNTVLKHEIDSVTKRNFPDLSSIKSAMEKKMKGE